jgi:hypothetical protein
MKINLTFLLFFSIYALYGQNAKITSDNKISIESIDSSFISSNDLGLKNTILLSGNLPILKGSWNAMLFINNHIAVGGEFQYWNSTRNTTGKAYGSLVIDKINTEYIKKGKEYGLTFRYYDTENFPRLFLGLGIFTGKHNRHVKRVESGKSIDFLTNNETSYYNATNSFADFKSNNVRLSAGIDFFKESPFSLVVEGGIVLRNRKYATRLPNDFEPFMFPAMLRLMFGYKFTGN